MNYPLRILLRSLVVPFYRENATTLFFLFVVMIGVVNMVDGAGLLEYHYFLALGMLKSKSYLLLVFAGWFLYMRKCTGFVAQLTAKDAYSFLHIYRALPPVRQWALLLVAEVALLLPVLLYALFVGAVGWHEGRLIPVAVILLYLLLLCMFTAVWHMRCIQEQYGYRAGTAAGDSKVLYPVILLRYVARTQKVLWLGIKIYSCGIVYLIARNNTMADYDFSFPFLFFSFGVLANGMLIYRVREMEETQLQFFRSLPVALWKRGLSYVALYALLLLPEAVTAAGLTPVHLHKTDAWLLVLAAYSLLLFINSLSFVRWFSSRQYLKVLVSLFLVAYVFLICAALSYMCLLLAALAACCFYRYYYRFQPGSTFVHKV